MIIFIKKNEIFLSVAPKFPAFFFYFLFIKTNLQYCFYFI